MDFYLDANHDIEFESGDLRMTTPIEELRQMLSVRFNTQKGEFLFDQEYGMDYLPDTAPVTILGKGQDLNLVLALIKDAILIELAIFTERYAITADLISFTHNFQRVARTLSVSFVVKVGAETVQVVAEQTEDGALLVLLFQPLGTIL